MTQNDSENSKAPRVFNWGNDTERLLSELYSEINGKYNLDIEDVDVNRDKKVAWACTIHQRSWLATLNERMAGYLNCRDCERDEFIRSGGLDEKSDSHSMDAFDGVKSIDDFKTDDLDWGEDKKLLLLEWDVEGNNRRGFSPKYADTHRDRKFRWKCHTHGSEWFQSLTDRIASQGGCLKCEIEEKKRSVGVPDSTVFPSGESMPEYGGVFTYQLVNEWYAEVNMRRNITMKDAAESPEMRVSWKCDLHQVSWVASLADRLIGKHNCYKCNRKDLKNKAKRADLKANDLGMNSEQLLREWDYAKNAKLGLNPRTAGMADVCWWACEEAGHEWQNLLVNRVNGVDCPCCATHNFTGLV